MAGVTGVLGAFRGLKDAFPLLKVAGNAALSGVLFGLETLLDMRKPCPCVPELNRDHVAVMFLVPAVVLFMVSLAALPDSRRLLKGWTGAEKGEGETQQECGCRFCRCRCCRCLWVQWHIALNALLNALIPSFIWVIILLLDGDQYACIYHTQADVGPGDSQGCKQICSDDPTTELRRHCCRSWVIGCVLLAVSVGLLTILPFIPARKCGDCTQEGDYVIKFFKELDAVKEIKMEEKITARVEECADEQAQKLLEVLKLSDPKKKDQGTQHPDQDQGQSGHGTQQSEQDQGQSGLGTQQSGQGQEQSEQDQGQSEQGQGQSEQGTQQSGQGTQQSGQGQEQSEQGQGQSGQGQGQSGQGPEESEQGPEQSTSDIELQRMLPHEANSVFTGTKLKV